MDDDGYAGPAEVLAGDTVAAVTVRLTGHFDPIRSSYHWYGRVSASPSVTALAGRRVLLRTPQGTVETALADIDPWGRLRVEGFGAAPFEVLDRLP